MNPNKYTKKSLEAVQSAQDISVSYQNNCVEQEHLLYALLTQDGSLTSQILTKMNIDANAVQQAALHFIEGMPRVSGSGREAGKIYVSPDLDKAFTEAEAQAERMKDEYVSVEHLLLALAEKPSSGVSGIFRSFGVTKDKLLKAVSEIRGSARVTSQEPEETYDEFIIRCSTNCLGRYVKILDLEDNLNVTRLTELTPSDSARVNKYLRSLRFLKTFGS